MLAQVSRWGSAMVVVAMEAKRAAIRSLSDLFIRVVLLSTG